MTATDALVVGFATILATICIHAPHVDAMHECMNSTVPVLMSFHLDSWGQDDHLEVPISTIDLDAPTCAPALRHRSKMDLFGKHDAKRAHTAEFTILSCHCLSETELE